MNTKKAHIPLITPTGIIGFNLKPIQEVITAYNHNKRKLTIIYPISETDS
jgi:hypothetical protein